MFGLACNFFTLPSKKKMLKIAAETLAVAVCIETTLEILFSSSETELLPEIIIPYMPFFIGLMAGIQSDLLLEGTELKENAKRLATWIEKKLTIINKKENLLSIMP
ncbi:MAG: hypothetical protein A3F11_11585 [Gammaproteobacteria bacterium RIFCSPHIGHO2_12_FULL_37_14]|nr:MAG: hypothetical protein A3F11_11585 [Gammaproteobacteria bacterium RIFCSPHIGHO2_12_FULL_37_14]